MTEKLSYKLPMSMGELSERAREASDAIESNVGHTGARMITSPDSEIKDVSKKDKLLYAAIGGLASLAATPLVSRYILKNKRLSIPLTLANTIAGAATGYIAPDVSNIIKQEVKGKITPEKAKELIYDAELPKRELPRKFENYFQKESSLVGGVAGLAKKVVTGTGGAVWKGINPRYGLKKGTPTPFGRKALAFGVRGGLGAGAMYGAYKGYKSLTGPKSKRNYTTMLRNNILAGNIKPGELSQEDLISVRRLGLR